MSSVRVPFVDLAAEYTSIRVEIDEAVGAVLRKGWYILGAQVAAFEREFAAFCGVEHGVGVASGTDAIHLAIRACGITAGDEVVTVANVSAPTVCAIVAAGARPRFADVRSDTMTMDPRRVDDLLRGDSSHRIKAIVPVHLYGHPAEIDRIVELARGHGAAVIEDACQAHGTTYNGRHVGSFGDAGCFSFYPTKNLGAYGDGGLVVCRDGAIAERVRMLRCYGEASKYKNLTYGINSRLDELQAAILRVKLRHLTSWNERRRSLAARYMAGLAGAGVETPVEAAGAFHTYHLYVVRSSRREALQAALRERGIGTSVHYPIPIHFQDAYRDLGYSAGDLPQTEACCAEVLSLPISTAMPPESVDIVCDAIRAFGNG